MLLLTLKCKQTELLLIFFVEITQIYYKISIKTLALKAVEVLYLFTLLHFQPKNKVIMNIEGCSNFLTAYSTLEITLFGGFLQVSGLYDAQHLLTGNIQLTGIINFQHIVHCFQWSTANNRSPRCTLPTNKVRLEQSFTHPVMG